MKRQLLLYSILLFLFSHFAYSQGEAKKWYFGNGLGLDFSTSPPTVLTNGAMTATAGCSSICNAAGNLLFYTDGQTVWNQQHLVMANGSGLLGFSGAQNCVIVKKPGSASLYYLFTVAGGGNSAGLNYSIVDMTLAAGLGSVTVKNSPVYAASCEEKITAGVHCNQADAWIIIHPMNTGTFQSYLLTSAGLNMAPVTSTAGPLHIGPSTKGQMKLSPNAKRLLEVYTESPASATASPYACSYVGFELYNFNNSTGVLSGTGALGSFACPQNNCWGYGAEFSADGKMFYTTYHNQLMQYNYCGPFPVGNGNIGPPPTETASTGPFQPHCASLQLGPDGKIYVANAGYPSLGVINNPGNPGNACNYQNNGIPLSTTASQFGLPSFYTNYFEQSPTQSFTATPNLNDCMTVNFLTGSLCTAMGYSLGALSWSFGDPASGAANTSTLLSPSHTFSSPGTYSVTLIANFLCGRFDTVRRTIQVAPTHTASAASATLNCTQNSATVTSTGGIGPFDYNWYPSSYHTATVSGIPGGVYTVTVTDLATGCMATTSLSVNSQIGSLSATVSANPICSTATSGSAAVLASGGSGSYSYAWQSSTQTTSLATGLPAGAQTVSVTDLSNNCSVMREFNLQATLAASISPNTVSVCVGSSITLNASGIAGVPGYTYAWTGGPSSAALQVSQNSIGSYSYSVTVTDAAGCAASRSVTIWFVNPPSLSFSGMGACPNTISNLAASGASSYTWHPTNFTGSVLHVPASNANYTVIGSIGQCSVAGAVTLTLLPLPVPAITSNNTLFCAGEGLQLNGSGGSAYYWSGPDNFAASAQSASIANLNTFNSGEYTLNVTGSNSCQSSTVILISVQPVPALSVSGNLAICLGQQQILTASGAGQFHWSTGANSAAVAVSPTSTTTYSLTGVAGQCSSTVLITVTVTPLPTALISSGSASYCAGQSMQLNGSGGINYYWTGPFGFSSFNQAVSLNNLSPVNGGLYTLDVADGNNCHAATAFSVSVFPRPVLSISGNHAICSGQHLVLTAAGASYYQWTNGITTASVNLNPATTTTYTVTGTGSSGCSSSASVTVSVSGCVGIGEATGDALFSVYPNPGSGIFAIEADRRMHTSVYSLTGSLILDTECKSGKTTIDLSAFSDGIYILKCSFGDQTRTTKLIKTQEQ